MTARRIKSLHHNLKEGENVVFHREHRSKKGKKRLIDPSIALRKYKLQKKYGRNAEAFDI